VRKTAFLSNLYIKTNILPRQARDEHRENSKKSAVFPQPNRRHTLDADGGGHTGGDGATTLLPFSAPPRRLGGSLEGGARRVPVANPNAAGEEGGGDQLATQEQRTALQREFQAVQRARAAEQAQTRARLAELQL
jgi:hypothetical protein